MLRRIFSYFLPIKIHSQKSSVSKNLEVTWANGQLVLDSQNTNYSYGSLQRILRRGLKEIGFEKVRRMQHILLLGVAGGSVVKTLSEEIGCIGKITGVEIDASIIKIANEFFGLDKIPNLEIIIDDAFEFVLKTRQKYDLIIIDVFKDTEMPNFLFEKFFCNRLTEILHKKGYILFNTMTLTADQDARNQAYISQYPGDVFAVRTIPRVEDHNELIVVQSLGQ